MVKLVMGHLLGYSRSGVHGFAGLVVDVKRPKHPTVRTHYREYCGYVVSIILVTSVFCMRRFYIVNGFKLSESSHFQKNCVFIWLLFCVMLIGQN